MFRRLVLVAATVTVASGVTGCNATKRELTVVFAAGVTPAQQASTLAACTGAAAHTSPEPVPTPSGRFKPPGIRFRIDQASDRDIAQLEACLQRQPGVRGFQDSVDGG